MTMCAKCSPDWSKVMEFNPTQIQVHVPKSDVHTTNLHPTHIHKTPKRDHESPLQRRIRYRKKSAHNQNSTPSNTSDSDKENGWPQTSQLLRLNNVLQPSPPSSVESTPCASSSNPSRRRRGCIMGLEWKTEHPMVVAATAIPAYHSLHFSCVPIDCKTAKPMRNNCCTSWPEEYTLEVKAVAILNGWQLPLEWHTFSNLYCVMQTDFDNALFCEEHFPLLVKFLHNWRKFLDTGCFDVHQVFQNETCTTQAQNHAQVCNAGESYSECHSWCSAWFWDNCRLLHGCGGQVLLLIVGRHFEKKCRTAALGFCIRMFATCWPPLWGVGKEWGPLTCHLVLLPFNCQINSMQSTFCAWRWPANS